MAGEWAAWRRRVDPYADPALALLVLGLSLQPLLADPHCDCGTRSAWAFLLVAAQCAPITVRRRWPFAALFVTGMASGVYGVSPLPDPPVYYAALVLVYTVAAHGTRREAHISAAITVVSVAVALALDWPAWDYQDVTVLVATMVTAYVLGDGARSRREAADALQARAVQLERTRAAESAAAVSAERTRIARDLHDSVAHHVSVIVVQAEAGPVTVERAPETAVRTFESIGATGRQALTEMRQLLGVLRSDTDAPLEPTPGLAQVDRLVEQARSAGIDVVLRTTGRRTDLPTPVDLSAYRLVQEALTNCLRHAPGSFVEVGIEYGDPLSVTITDSGSPSDRQPHRADGSTEADGPHGTGLAAMRERVGSVGGTLDVGPAGSGWLVSARFPTSAASTR